ncbi:KedN5 family methylcobalamin-dependent radical SAM C-methyltransferase [Solihabitans fulvus]|uniref:KedN5 family methylcobalamin-dependent radical SAM C-methyltransferase n=1 Tax=Solihabitans fulvus TaxID=1892852 RepID=A0A5B2XSM6_9PSEU|nr:KedN5 family methylcobalamin-dependent radical SAM C-methyltransferase [Solihabitans fulvus]KAA2265821.1 KedN5 family methylcobalamin-dependent radical SAM C-methyltransferase [Solihabitans fulvus]
MSAGARRHVWLVQRGAWDMPIESMPLAAGYLKATALADEAIHEAMRLEIFNFGGAAGNLAICHDLFADQIPDVLACSVLGWNFRSFVAIAQTFKQLNPSGWVVFGGTHVAHQANRLLRQHPEIDIIVNSEGEFIFRDLLLAYLRGHAATDLASVEGLSFRDTEGVVVTTAQPDPISDLSLVPSPFLTGAIPLHDRHGRFRYDVALMETNRGCPYHCAFCYWGGAIAQKVRGFPRERLRAELDLLAYHGAHTVVLCDANFGMLPADLEFVEDVIHIRERSGFPRALETSWAKNKSAIFHQIVRSLKEHGLTSSFTLALQTLDDDVLQGMHRRNMRLNDWEELARWLRSAGLDAYAELIWGAPGETYQSFLDGYDRLARLVPRIAVYPLLVLPNTAYAANRDALGLVTVRGDQDDYDYVAATPDISLADNNRMQRFVLWARGIAENLVLRTIWTPLHDLAGLRQSWVLLRMADWFRRSTDPSAAGLNLADHAIGQPGAVLAFLRHLHTDHQVPRLLRQWWHEEIEPRTPEAARRFLTDLFEYDLCTLPLYDPASRTDLEMVGDGHTTYYVRRDVAFQHDVPGALAAMAAGATDPPSAQRWVTDLWFKAGFANHLDNHELTAQFIGQPAAPDAPPATVRAPGGVEFTRATTMERA